MAWLSDILSPLSDFFFWILEFLHESLGIKLVLGDRFLTVIVRIVLIPLTWRQIKSMRAMQALAPQIKALQEKYKNDRQLLNQKTMEFYQENKVSPFGSCLPLLLQMPVFFGLFYMLRTQGGGPNPPSGAVRLPSNPTVGWLWIADITKFDIILMFLYIASQFVASWQMSRKGAGQQKMIAYFMPVMVGIFMFIGKWPAGLFIYWFTSNLWTIAQQYVAEKLMPDACARGGSPRPKAEDPGQKRRPGRPRRCRKVHARRSRLRRVEARPVARRREQKGRQQVARASGRTVELAVQRALAELDFAPGELADDQYEVTIIIPPEEGFMGVGAVDAVVEVALVGEEFDFFGPEDDTQPEELLRHDVDDEYWPTRISKTSTSRPGGWAARRRRR